MINKDIGISYQELKSRGPVTGKYLSKVCHEIYFIIEGSAKIIMNGVAYEVSKNDVVVIEPNTPHYIETEYLRYITITRPDWFEEQAEIID